MWNEYDWRQNSGSSINTLADGNEAFSYLPLWVILCYCCSFAEVTSLWDPVTVVHQAPLSTISQSLPKFMSIESVMLSNHISSSASPFSFCLQPFPASGSFPVSWFFKSNGQCIWSSATVLPMNIQGWFPLGLTRLTSLLSKRLSTSQFKSINSLVLSLLYGPTLTSVHDYWKNHSFDLYGPLSAKWSLLFNMLPWFVVAFLPRSSVF